MKKQRKETRLKRKRLKAAYNTILEENRRLKGWQSVYGRKEIRTFGERKTLTIFEAGSDNMGEIIKDRMAVEIFGYDEKEYPERMLQRAAGWCKAVQGVRGKILSELSG